MSAELASDWQEQAAKYKEQGKYAEAAQLYEQAIEQQPEVASYYWHLGLLLLLEGKEEDAQLTWLSAMVNDDPESQDLASKELFRILTEEAQRQQDSQNLKLAWVICHHAREVDATDLDNLLALIALSLELGTFQGEELQELGVLKLLQNEKVAVKSELLLSVLEKLLNTAPLEPYVLDFVEVCAAHAQPPERFIDVVLVAAERKIAYSEQRPALAVEFVEKCLPLETKQLQVLIAIAGLSQKAGQYERGIVTAQQAYDLAAALSDKLFTSALLVRGLARAGGHWDDAFAIFQEQQALLAELAQEEQSTLELATATSLLTTTFFQPYFRDDPRQNRTLQNQMMQLIPSSLHIHRKQRVDQYQQGHQSRALKASNRKLRIGYLSHCFKRHSVGWLSRWLFEHHDREQFQIYTYFVGYKSQGYDPLQYWFAEKADFARKLEANSLTIADQINQDQIDILIDLDSITYYVTCEIMALKPAPIQVTWLGWDASGLPAIDYFLADAQVLPDNADEYYSEKIWRLPDVYVAVDGFEVGIPTLRRDELEIPEDATIYLSAQSGYKRHPDTIRLQMKILKQVPNSYFLVKGPADQEAVQDVFSRIAQEEGVDPNRLRFLQRVPSEEIHRADLGIADVVLDTYPYNGATTTLETLWMGIPLVTRVGEQFSARNSYTFLKNVGVSEGIAWSDEEYIEWGVKLGTDQELRKKVTWQLWQSRQRSPLWNAKQFTGRLETAYKQMWEKYVTQNANEQLELKTSSTLNLHIGGKEQHSDWKIVNVEPRPEVDYVANASDLSIFESNSVDRIYSSHTLEHFYYGLNNELVNTLKEWNRVLKPGGKVMISVPDLEVLSRLYIRNDLDFNQRFHIMRMMFGGQTNIYDVHKVGFDFMTLKVYLEKAGFQNINRVKEFNLFKDCSSLKFLDTLISLNIVAYK